MYMYRDKEFSPTLYPADSSWVKAVLLRRLGKNILLSLLLLSEIFPALWL